MKIRELVHLMSSVWFKEFASPLIDADTFEPVYPQITGDTEITDSYLNNMLVKKDDHIIEIRCGCLFSIKLCITAFPFAYAPLTLFMDIIYMELSKMGWMKSVCATLILNCDGNGATGLEAHRQRNLESLVCKAVYDGIPESFSNLINTDWRKLSDEFRRETHCFFSILDFEIYGEMSNDWIKDFVTESFDSILYDLQNCNKLECIAVLLDWKKKNIPDEKEDMML